MIRLHDPQDFSSMYSKSSPFSDFNVDGVFVSHSSSIGFPFFSCYQVSLFASYFKTGNSYLLFLDRWHFLATSFVRFLSMYIIMDGLSPIDILLSVVHTFFSYNLLVPPAMDCR